MKRLLSLLSVLTITGTSLPTTIAVISYKNKEIKLRNSKINYLARNNLEILNRNKRQYQSFPEGSTYDLNQNLNVLSTVILEKKEIDEQRRQQALLEQHRSIDKNYEKFGGMSTDNSFENPYRGAYNNGNKKPNNYINNHGDRVIFY